jgi:hypothetical protein
VLKKGTMLIAAGADNSGLLASAEAFDAAGAGSVAAGSVNPAPQNAAATLLNNDTALIVGGAAQAGTCAAASAEIFHPATGVVIPTGSILSARRGHRDTLLKPP